tara:strand:+ start:1 stop:1407 length:1407 start_codon:yes stop_codon:yes gene_type:complete
MNKTKIIATIGPGCDSKEALQKLVDSGVVCFRINLSHGSNDNKKKYFDLIKYLTLSERGRPTILADLAGPKIRIEELKTPLKVKKGDLVEITNEKTGERAIPVSRGIKFRKLNPGARILIDDGRIALEVKERITDNTILCQALESGEINSKKGVNFPGVELDIPALTEQDKKDLALSLKSGADWIALSFVRSHRDYKIISEKIKDLGYSTPVIAKVEKWEAVENAQAIIKAFDAVMVARGDLGVEVPLERVPAIQKNVIKIANDFGKPVIIATQILDSMINRTTPTRAEVSDIANAIIDGADSLMVTGETAVGKHPQKVIKVLKRVIEETELSAINKQTNSEPAQNKISTAKAISHAACTVARVQKIDILVTMTHSGSTARMVARHRPNTRIVAMTPFKEICRRLNLVWGVEPIVVSSYSSSDEIPGIITFMLKRMNIYEKGKKFIVTGGVPVGLPGTTNYLSVLSFD